MLVEHTYCVGMYLTEKLCVYCHPAMPGCKRLSHTLRNA